jgi:5'-deoxynucleotidase YfbR-like HD superfamily hydrolase
MAGTGLTLVTGRSSISERKNSMENFTDLFKLLELTRSQPQYGYALSGIAQNEMSNLAEHQYLVSIFAWVLAKRLESVGAKVNVQKVLEYSLVHDLGELFGGDISMPYAQVNKKARKLAKAFEAENIRYFSKFFGEQQKNFKKLGREIQDAKSDDALVAKIADYLECVHYKFYVKNLAVSDVKLNGKKLLEMTKKLKDKVAKTEMQKFINEWMRSINKKTTLEILT